VVAGDHGRDEAGPARDPHRPPLAPERLALVDDASDLLRVFSLEQWRDLFGHGEIGLVSIGTEPRSVRFVSMAPAASTVPE